MKKRILLCNDSSFMSTGFGTYGSEVLKRLAESQQFELAELACYGFPNDPRQGNLPWKYYGNLPITEEESEIYRAVEDNKHGAWKFDAVCLDFKPNIVWDIRDCQMMGFEERSPARPYFHHCIMPTIDSVPLHPSWLATYMLADSVFSWTEWGLREMQLASANRINTQSVCGAGVSNAFVPVQDKQAYKQSAGLPADSIVIGTVMRNQKRKLFPDLIESFARLREAVSDEVRKNLYLYLHTGYPDIHGWMIPSLLKEYGIASKTLFTYICQKCEKVYPSFYQDVRAVCKFCGNFSAMLPHTQYSPAAPILAQIYNLFDLYVQYASCEAFGLPMIEAAACGCPVFALDYSAMADIIHKVSGTPIKVARYFRNIDSNSLWALPDNEDFIRKVFDFIQQPDTMRMRAGFAASKAAKENFSWDATANTWREFFENLTIEDLWAKPRRIHHPTLDIPNNLSNAEFIQWCMINILGRSDLANSYLATDLTHELNYGYYKDKVLSRDVYVEHFLKMRQEHNKFEVIRCR